MADRTEELLLGLVMLVAGGLQAGRAWATGEYLWFLIAMLFGLAGLIYVAGEPDAN